MIDRQECFTIVYLFYNYLNFNKFCMTIIFVYNFIITHGNINNCDDKMFILVDSVSTLSIMNGSNLTLTFKNQIGHIA